MDIIYTPWRYEYVSTVDSRGAGCVFCEKCAGGDDRENLIVYRGQRCFAILNLFPYSTGHLMIPPLKHTSTIEELDPDTLTEMMTMAQLCMRAIREAFHPDGFNVGINIARVAGAGITDHVHMHVVPRWSGDSNFMPVCSDTRIMPLDLDAVWKKLTERLSGE